MISILHKDWVLDEMVLTWEYVASFFAYFIRVVEINIFSGSSSGTNCCIETQLDEALNMKLINIFPVYLNLFYTQSAE